MARYYFNLRDGGGGYRDADGINLEDDAAAVAYANIIAAELVRNRERRTRQWRLSIENEAGEIVFETALIAYDRTIAHFAPSVRRSMEDLGRRCLDLREAITQSRSVTLQARATIARSRGKPYLVRLEGEPV